MIQLAHMTRVILVINGDEKREERPKGSLGGDVDASPDSPGASVFTSSSFEGIST